MTDEENGKKPSSTLGQSKVEKPTEKNRRPLKCKGFKFEQSQNI